MNRASTTPTASEATAPSTTDSTIAVVPEVKSHGASGMKAPRANVTNEAAAACQGEPEVLRRDPELLAGVGLQGELGVLHDLVDHVAGHGGVDAPSHVHAPELGRLALGAAVERPALHLELALHQLALGGHGEVLAGRHGEGAGDQPGHPGQAHDRPAGVGAGHAEDQGDVGDQAVADPEDGRPGPATPDVAVLVWCGIGVVLVRVAHRRQRSEVPHAGSVPQRNQTLTSEERTMTTIVDGVDAFHELVGKELGHSEWQTITQERVNLFADATDDHQWIHVDPERAKEGPFGVAIAHGYLTLSLAPVLLNKIIRVDNMKFGVNYGCNKVRFPSPVPVGSDLRMGVTVAGVDDVEGGVQVTYDLVMEVKDAPKPACVAQVVYRYYR